MSPLQYPLNQVERIPGLHCLSCLRLEAYGVTPHTTDLVLQLLSRDVDVSSNEYRWIAESMSSFLMSSPSRTQSWSETRTWRSLPAFGYFSVSSPHIMYPLSRAALVSPPLAVIDQHHPRFTPPFFFCAVPSFPSESHFPHRRM